MENKISVTISGDSLKFEGMTSITKAAQIIAFMNSTEVSSSGNSVMISERAPGDSLLGNGSLKTSPRQRLIESEAKINSEKIAVFVDYIKRYQNISPVKVQDIKILFNKAGEPSPKNISRDLKDAVRSNYIFESGDGEYEITEFGNEAIDKKFALENTNRAKTERKRSKSKSVELRKEITDIELSSAEKGFPAFHNLNKGQQILWICAVVDNRNKINELNSAEIVHLIDKLKGNVTAGSFTAHNAMNIKKGYIKPSKNGFKVTQDGIDRLQEIGKPLNEQKN